MPVGLPAPVTTATGLDASAVAGTITGYLQSWTIDQIWYESDRLTR